MIGKKVKLTKRMAKWLIDHQEWCHTRSGTVFNPDDSYDAEMWVCLMVMGDWAPTGVVIKKGMDCWGVEFKTPFGKEFSYYSRSDLRLV